MLVIIRNTCVLIFMIMISVGAAYAGKFEYDIYGNYLILRDKHIRSHAPSPNKDKACREYANRALAQNRTNLKLRCGFTGPRWHSNYDSHYQWCMRASPQLRISETRARARQLAQCSKRTSPNKNKACREYASRALAQNRTNLKLRCGFTGPRWHSNYNSHYQWCMRASLQQRISEMRARVRQLEQCSKRASPNKDKACREYASRALAQNRTNLKLRCGFTGPRWHSNYNSHYQWCMRASPQQRISEMRARVRQLEQCSKGRPDTNIRAFLGIWEFGRSQYHFQPTNIRLCEVRLTAKWVKRHGYELKACNDNEAYWNFVNGNIVFYNYKGVPSTIFHRVAHNEWRGKFLLKPEDGVIHYLRR